MLPSVIGGPGDCFCLAMADHRRLSGESGSASPGHIVAGMSKTSTQRRPSISVRLDAEIKNRLEREAKRERRTPGQ
jgi:hypothetical protein